MKFNPIEIIRFTGAKKTYATIGASAVVDVGRTGPGEENIVDITATAHGFLAGPSVQKFTCAYVKGSTNYAGLKRIYSVPDANSIYFFNNFTAETPAGTETLRTAYTSDRPFNWLGFEIHLSAASSTSENLVVSKDSDYGTAFDTKIYTKNMNTVQDIIFMVPEEEPIVCASGTVVDLTWDNTNNLTWGVKFFIKADRS